MGDINVLYDAGNKYSRLNIFTYNLPQAYDNIHTYKYIHIETNVMYVQTYYISLVSTNSNTSSAPLFILTSTHAL